ncbi:heat repeat-containing protein : HEAT repeat-containing protein OS=Singulisphaera acidiphila (strain ATCC BAA-1392 / DSM 18658 / VKM B-2454 / MOB10) GN=Sinac_5393 PE=4 SV=1: HEAT_2: HEAT_2: HEAT_EZ: HEAT_2: HEAT_2: HEAT_2 [Gemmataceae bacterium]|nr:heat repeat-containing protein : HEAT repeat-containing protein OS=Singulisphaera acidiphila (strain ATCC BAA-1392 / DSM 18658 / VKM B-2454 / MOB10) GN=Sinac_5393 PE=4 SV=1: HEAT_2: HEAT_2: HEAT_EZ: HEAT_2: HEAT_2: HEAT_2 [Gemmataceae bacterium]VTU01919.1 heat repeat-containing protein : HEAT repeat-containing protein OS=Singulisphaera acidiphila (strain ATCC BAA-1392 / DSM 18658 / VKM B-2454 / MOB10) GN=Sinac_5393 PE=4 SV=1: HEAT_2: HEAT_2: HEAT_EZ: HEAT_2: HEAT_2: HEAT_2 [Gemmataceae bacteriu
MDPWLVRLDHRSSSYSILSTLVVVAVVVGVVYQTGLLGWALGLFGRFTRWGIRSGFGLWERTLSWADWTVYAGLSAALLVVGALVADDQPWVALACAVVTLVMGLASCLAYMFIDIERYEVERGRKAVHNPTKGQALATTLARYGHRVGLPLLAVATASVICGFSLLNKALYETVGERWYRVEDDGEPGFVDFLAYALINLLSLVDVLNVADSRRLVHTAFVQKAMWPAAVLLAAFRSFFTLVLLQQVFASVRQGRILAETITDFWSPHESIHDRARNALPQFGVAAISPLLVSLRQMDSLTKEQRDRLPQVLAAIGPSTVPTLVEHLTDPHEHVRAIAAGTLGLLQAREATAEIAAAVGDASDLVRLSAAEALGRIAAAEVKAERARLVKRPRHARRRWHLFGRPRHETGTGADPLALAVSALQKALGDPLAAVRCQAAGAIGRVGAAAVGAVAQLVPLLGDADETVRCRAAETIGEIGGPAEALRPCLDDPSAAVRAAAAAGLKLLGGDAKPVVEKLVELLQDRDEAVRTAAADAVAAAGPLNGDSTTKLAAGLASADNVVRAQTAEALGNVGAAAEHAAPPLVEALDDHNDVVRAKAVEALGKIGETAAPVAVPGLVKALRDADSWVSALAAEALGEMGDGAGESVVTALVHALRHVNPQVRANAAEALGKLGPAAAWARSAVERAAADEDGPVRAAAVRALGGLCEPTPSTLALVRNAIRDADPLVRAAAAAAVGSWDRPGDAVLDDLLPLLRDANDDVKVQVASVLPRLAGATGPVIDGLCQMLAEDDSALVQGCAAIALARLGPVALAAGPTLLRAAKTGEAGVREQAVRALVMIQPPEAIEGFTAGLIDPSGDVRVVASAGWIKAATVPPDAAPALVEALRDPEAQVRANVAFALSRLDELPPAAVPLLVECASDPNDGLRLNAAVALQLAPPDEVADLMDHLLDDPNVRIRLVAARAVLTRSPGNERGVAVVTAASADPSPRVRQGAEELAPLLVAQVTAPPEDPLPVPALSS